MTMFVWIIQPTLLSNNNNLKIPNAEMAIQVETPALFHPSICFLEKEINNPPHIIDVCYSWLHCEGSTQSFDIQ